MRTFYFNPETRIGYISEPLTDEEAEGIIHGLGWLAAIYGVVLAITVLCLIPFFVTGMMYTWGGDFLRLNAKFLLLLFGVLLLIRLTTEQLSRSVPVRLLFSMIFMAPILYFLLFKLHLGDFTVLLGQKIVPQLFESVEVDIPFLSKLIEKSIPLRNHIGEFFLARQGQIDYSVFTSTAAAMDVGAIVITLVRIILLWIGIVLAGILTVAVGLVVCAIGVSLPFLIAYAALAFVNNAIFRIKKTYCSYLKF